MDWNETYRKDFMAEIEIFIEKNQLLLESILFKQISNPTDGKEL